MFKKSGPIKSRVLAIIENRIDEAEIQYLNGCDRIDSEADAQVEEIYEKADAEKSNLATELVTSILGKVI